MRNALPAAPSRSRFGEARPTACAPIIIGAIAVAQALPQCVGGRNEETQRKTH